MLAVIEALCMRDNGHGHETLQPIPFLIKSFKTPFKVVNKVKIVGSRRRREVLEAG